jgi:unsaturated rhamnogalacturonyl hydrolase
VEQNPRVAKYFRVLLTAGIVILTAGLLPGARPAAAATDWGRALVDSTMRRYPDARTLTWTYPRALFLYGQYLVYQRTLDSRYLNYVKAWGEAHVGDDGSVFVDAARRQPVVLSAELDQLLPGQLILILLRETGKEKYRLAAMKLRQRFDDWPRTADGGLWHRWALTDQLWLDGLYMSVPFLLEYGRDVGDTAYAQDEGANQLLIYGSHLQDPRTGLLYHGYAARRDTSWADPATGRSPEFWCRGVGWYGMALVEVLDLLPATHAKQAQLLALLQSLAAGLAKYQDPLTGRWFEVVDKGALPANWLETSCSSMFAYVLGHAVERGYLPAAFHEPASRGYQGVLDTISLDSAGLTNLVETVVGTGVGDLAYYLTRPRATNDWHGLGAFLIMHEQFNRRPADSVFRWVEAESGKLTAPMQKRADAKASGGWGIQVAAGLNSTAKPPRKGTARYTLQLPRAGQYRIWGRVIAPTVSDDTFWLRVDDGAWRVWQGIGLGKAWHWADVHTAAATGEPLLLGLSAGGHTLDIAYREDGARLDRLLITNATAFVPGGPGD